MHHPLAICISAISTLAPLAIWRGVEGEAVFAGGAMQPH